MTIRPVLLLILPALVLGGCGGDDVDPAAPGTTAVVTALYPLAFVAERVGGDDVTVTNLAAPGVEPHDLELSPRQVGSIAEADLVLVLEGFAPAVDEAVAQNAAERALHVDELIPLMESSGEDGHDGGHAEEPAHEDGHDHGGVDPHFWLDPTLMGELANGVAERLGEIDPDHVDAYAARAATLVGELDELDGAYDAGLASCETTTIVTAHAAFGYLTQRYGLEQYSVAGLEPDAEPSAARVAEVQTEIEAQDVSTVYFEPLAGADVVESIAGDLDLQTAELDPVESVDEAGDEDYLTVMRANLATLQVGQRCG